MSEAEEKYMYAKLAMANAIMEFYESCELVGIDLSCFMEDVNDAVEDAAGIRFELY